MVYHLSISISIFIHSLMVLYFLCGSKSKVIFLQEIFSGKEKQVRIYFVSRLFSFVFQQKVCFHFKFVQNEAIRESINAIFNHTNYLSTNLIYLSS